MKKIYLILPILAGLMFGSGGVFVRTLTENGIDNITILFLRYSIAIIPMIISILIIDKDLFKIKLKDLPLILICAMSIVGLNLCYNEAIITISLSLAAVLLSTAPIFVIIFAYILFREKITSKKLLSMILAIFGCLLMSGVFEMSWLNISWYGILFGIGSGIFWAVYVMSSKRSIENGNHTFTILLYSIIIISIALLPFISFNQINSFISLNPILVILFLIAHSTVLFVIPYILSTLSLNYIDSGVSSILLSGCEPLAALIFGFSLYNEIPSLLMLSGLVLAVISIITLSKQ